MEKKRYRRVLHACALNPDISILPAGDQTEIGEKVSHFQSALLETEWLTCLTNQECQKENIKQTHEIQKWTLPGASEF